MKKRLSILLILCILTIIGNSCSKEIMKPHYKVVARTKQKLFSKRIKKVEYKVAKIRIKKRFLFGDVMIIRETSSKKRPVGNIPCN